MLYISGKITGINDYEERFLQAEKFLIEQGLLVINPVSISRSLPNYPFLDHDLYMKVDMMLLSLCDTIYMLKGWESSAGAKQELKYAIEHNYCIRMEV